jgi:Flp pilus assembly protein TadG
MMPIGRWEAPVKSLLARGYLHANDKFNNVITDAGRQAVSQDEDDTARQMIDTNNAIVNGKAQARANAEAIAVQLVDLAELSSKITGDDKAQALQRWARLILTRAVELLR